MTNWWTGRGSPQGRKNLTEKQKNHYKDIYGEKFMKPKRAEIMEVATLTAPGLAFVGGLPPAADAHYAGKGVKFGAADRPIFWYRPSARRSIE